MKIDYNAVLEILDNFLMMDSNKTEIAGISVSEEYQVKEAIRNLINGYKKQQEQLQEKDKHIQHIENINKHQSNDIKKAVDDNFELNKIISLMAEHIENGCDFDSSIQTKKQIIEYFTKKAREV